MRFRRRRRRRVNKGKRFIFTNVTMAAIDGALGIFEVFFDLPRSDVDFEFFFCSSQQGE
jgi:hypothetical protein